jgi:hypothetical protein
MTTTSIDIDRPADDVFAYVTDPTKFCEWQQGVVSGDARQRRTAQRPVGVELLVAPCLKARLSRRAGDPRQCPKGSPAWRQRLASSLLSSCRRPQNPETLGPSDRARVGLRQTTGWHRRIGQG